eukprot:scaffold188_cov336-Pavlova_lutheri.AAC.12
MTSSKRSDTRLYLCISVHAPLFSASDMTWTKASSETDDTSNAPPGTGARKLESPSFHQRVSSLERKTQINPAMSCFAGRVNEQVCVGTSFPPISYLPSSGENSVSMAISLTVAVPGGATANGGSSHIRRLSLDTPQWATSSALQSETMSTLVEPSSSTKAATKRDALSPSLKRRRHLQAGSAAASATYGSSGDLVLADSGMSDLRAWSGFRMRSRMSRFCVLVSGGGGGTSWDFGGGDGGLSPDSLTSSVTVEEGVPSSDSDGRGAAGSFTSSEGPRSTDAGSFNAFSICCRVSPERNLWASSALA